MLITCLHEVIFTGGVAQISGVVNSIENDAGIHLKVPKEPQITGALGAAIIAASKT